MNTDSTNSDILEVQSKLLPLSPLVARLEKILMLLPRRHIHVDLQVEEDIRVLDLAKGEYQSTGMDPRFEMRFSDDPIEAGWYYLEAALVRHSGNRTSKIYFDTGRGFNEADSIFIPSNLRGSIREVFYLPEGIQRLRWDPVEAPGWFSQSKLILHRVSKIESCFRRAWRVIEDIHRFKNQPVNGKRVSYLDVVRNLDEAYSWSANLRRSRTQGIEYAEFIRRNDQYNDTDRIRCLDHIESLEKKPRISIIMPVYNAPISFLKKAIDSIISQTYPNWELCIADDASTEAAVKKTLEQYEKLDSRIRVDYRSKNGHISAASNSALALSTGEYIALVDQDDLIPEYALYHVAVEINRHPDAALIYSDEDKVNEQDVRSDPYFKSDWDPDLFYSHNLITHLGVYRADIVHDIGGFRIGYEGSQDYDLAIRVASRVRPEQIRHIPRVLYHWRVHDGSTAAADSGSKPYAYEAALKTLNEHLASNGAKVEHGPHLGSYRVRHPIPTPAPLVSLVIPTKDKVEILSKCVDSILEKTTYSEYEIIIIDNRSEEKKTFEYLEKIARNRKVTIIKYDKPFNYSAINNFAVKQTNGSIIGLLNNDVEVIEPEWLTEMVSHAVRPEIGAVGAKLLYPDGRIQHSGVVLGLGGLAAHAHRFFDGESPGYCGFAYLTKSYSAVTGACLIVRREIYEAVGGLDEENLKVAYNDVDFCLRIRELGHRNLYTPYSVLYHHESISRGAEDTDEKRQRFAEETNYMRTRWGNWIDNDPYYNPNLTTSSEDFSLASHTVATAHHGYPLEIT